VTAVIAILASTACMDHSGEKTRLARIHVDVNS